MQAITGQFAACQYYINCSLLYYTHVSLPLCTKFDLPTKVGFRPNHRTDDHLDGCTGCWSNVVRELVCTAVHQHNRTSRKRSIEAQTFTRYRNSLHLLRCGASSCETSAKTLHSTRRNSINRKRVTYFRSKEERSKVTHCPPYSLTTVLQFSLEGDLMQRQEKQKGIRLSDQKEDCLTNLRLADDTSLFSTSLEKLRWNV